MLISFFIYKIQGFPETHTRPAKFWKGGPGSSRRMGNSPLSPHQPISRINHEKIVLLHVHVHHCLLTIRMMAIIPRIIWRKIFFGIPRRSTKTLQTTVPNDKNKSPFISLVCPQNKNRIKAKQMNLFCVSQSGIFAVNSVCNLAPRRLFIYLFASYKTDVLSPKTQVQEKNVSNQF